MAFVSISFICLLKRFLTRQCVIRILQRLFYFLTKDDGWLKTYGWPVVKGAADFWASRVVPEPTATGAFTVKGVVGPDESTGKVDDEA